MPVTKGGKWRQNCRRGCDKWRQTHCRHLPPFVARPRSAPWPTGLGRGWCLTLFFSIGVSIAIPFWHPRQRIVLSFRFVAFVPGVLVFRPKRFLCDWQSSPSPAVSTADLG